MSQGQNNEQNPFSVQKYLEGIDYPVDKDDLIDHAEQQDAPDEVLQLLDKLDDQEYNSPVDVTKQVSKVQGDQGGKQQQAGGQSRGQQSGQQRPRA